MTIEVKTPGIKEKVKVLDWSRAQAAIMNVNPAARALNAIFRDLMNTCDGATYFAGRVWGINTYYDIGEDHPLIGRSVPNFEFEDGKTIGELMYDGKGILLDFNSDAALEALAYRYGSQIKYFSGSAIEQLGLSVALIRPDGIIAWATDIEPDFSELKRSADRWFKIDE